MKPFDYAAPRSLPEALELLAAHPKAVLLAGGTDLLVQLRARRKQTDLVIDLKHLPELNALTYDAAAGLTLGAAVPCYRIYENPIVRQAYPALTEVAALVGGIQIQGRASAGGNLCNAAPSGDFIPILIALDAVAHVAGRSGTRDVKVEDFCAGPGKNVLQSGELLVSLRLPAPARGSGARYLRFIPRNEMDIAVVGAGVSVTLENGAFRSARIALSSVAPTPLFLPEAGKALAGKPVNDESIRAAAEVARAAVKPITDMRGTADYRRHLSAVLTRRAIEGAVQRAREAQQS